MSAMMYYDYERFKHDIPLLVKKCAPFRPDTIVAIARGGVTLGHALCMALDIRNLQTLRAESYDDTRQREELTLHGSCDFSDSKRVLIVDDIVDSGKTLAALLPLLRERHPGIEFRSASLFAKHSACMQPEYSLHEASDWIDFFWERDFLTEASV